MGEKEKMPADLAGWEQGKNAFFKFTEKDFAGSALARKSWGVLGYNIFASLSFLLKINKYFSFLLHPPSLCRGMLD